MQRESLLNLKSVNVMIRLTIRTYPRSRISNSKKNVQFINFLNFIIFLSFMK